MVIDQNEEQSSIIEETNSKLDSSIPRLTTIKSIVGDEVLKTLSETEERSLNNNNNISRSPKRLISNNDNDTTQPSPLTTLTKSHSPPTHYQYPSHSQQSCTNYGSIMRGTPISSSTLTNKLTAGDIFSTRSQSHQHHRHNPRYECSYLKSPQLLDRNNEQQHSTYIRHHTHQQQYSQPTQHKSPINKVDSIPTDTYETLRADYVTSKFLTTTRSSSHER